MTTEGVNAIGTTITFGTSGWAAEVLSISQSGISRPVLDVTHLGTTGNRAKEPGQLVDQGTVQLEWQSSPVTSLAHPGSTKWEPPITATTETITIEFDSTHTTGAKATFSAFVSGWDWAATDDARIKGNCELAINGDVTYADAAGA